jgi:primosomal replication protein N
LGRAVQILGFLADHTSRNRTIMHCFSFQNEKEEEERGLHPHDCLNPGAKV